MTITATEFKTNFGKYLNLLSEEDIYLKKNGKIVAKISQHREEEVSIVDSLVGILKNSGEIDEKALKEERIRKKCGY